jgi:ABC-2 type transport system permease protein
VVAQILRLKLDLLRNALRRSVAAIVGMAIGMLYGGGVLLAVLAALVALRIQPDLELARTGVVLGGTLLVAGWAIVPVLLFGIDPTLDPSRFATYAVPERQLATGLALAALIGLPGAATVLLALGSVVTWSRTMGGVVVAGLGAVCGVVTCVLLSRIVTASASAVLQTRRGRDAAGVGAFAALIAIAPVASLTGEARLSAPGLQRLADIAGWTPLGWSWAAPADAVEGEWVQACGRLLLAAGLCVGLFVVWERILASVLRNPRAVAAAGGTKAVRGLGLLGRLPGTPMGAIAAREAAYWVRDPRFNFPAVMTMLVPAGLLVPWFTAEADVALAAMPLASAYLIGWGQHNDVGYDSTAFWMHVASGVDGVSDRLGRLFPSASMAAVCVPSYALLAVALAGRWALLPALLGASAALVLNGFAVSCVTSAVKQYPVPKPGETPFATHPGGAGVTLAVQSVCGLAVGLLSLPALVLAVLAWLGHGWAGWAALVVGPLGGIAALAGGVQVGASLFERRAPELLQDLVASR